MRTRRRYQIDVTSACRSLRFGPALPTNQSAVDEKQYLLLADSAFKKIVDAFEDIDVDDADVEAAGDVITITYRGGRKCVVNTQRPARQIWLAGGQRAWHFSFDPASGQWLDDKGTGDELFATLERVTRESAGVALKIQ